MDDKTLERWRFWWNADVLDRPVMQIFAPKNKAYINRIENADEKWGSAEHILERELAYVNNTLFLAEAAHVINPNWSVGTACFFGCEPQFRDESVWVEPIYPDENILPEICFRSDNVWYKFMLDFTRLCTEAYLCTKACENNFFLTPHFGNSAADTLSLLRSDTVTMLDIIENPDWVSRAVKIIGNAIAHIFAEASSIIGKDHYYASWFGCVADEPVVIADADISCLISTQQFENLFLGQIVEQIKLAPYSQYHLDGPGALRHLDLLLAIPELNAIQWVPGAGCDEIIQWTDLIRKVQMAGKAIMVYAKPDEVMALLDEVSPKGLCINTHCSSEDEALALYTAICNKYRTKS